MPGHLKVDFEGAKGIAAALKTASADNVSQLDTLSGKAAPDAVWSGDAATAYTQAYDRYRTSQRALQQSLDELGDVVKKIIDKFEEIDRLGGSAL